MIHTFLKRIFLICMISCLGFTAGAGNPASTQNKQNQTPPLMAVIDVVNHCHCKQAFVKSLPDMLITDLTQTKAVRMVERTKINSAMKALQLESEGLTESSNLKIGQWLGADAIIVGSFHQLGEKYRLDARVVNARDGTIISAGGSLAREKDLGEVVPQVITQLLKGLELKDTRKPLHNKKIPTSNTSVKTGRLTIDCKLITGLFTERSVPFQKIRVYLNNKLIGTSETINALNRYFSVFNEEIPVGRHTLRLEHGKLDKTMQWAEPMPEQPKKLTIIVKQNQTLSIAYKMVAGATGYRFKDLNSR